MVRPCFLVIDREHPGSISTRKLVIETAKFNVITAYSGAEALETLTQFPNITAVVLDASVGDMSCDDLVAEIKKRDRELPLIVICPPNGHECPEADHMLENFNPVQLLTLLQSLVPKDAAAIEQRNEDLARSGA